jgi:predicted  nucleic acid-binding Zn-ribbon protein
MVRRLLEQTAALPVLGDQIGTSLETFGDRLVDGLNEIFGNRLATMLDEFQRSVRSELTESRARLDVLQQRVETGSKAASAVADAVASVRERIETFEMPSSSDVAGELEAVARSTTDLVDEVQTVRRTVEKLDRAGVIRRKRLDQVRAQVDAAAEATASGAEQIASELVAQREAMDELNTWLGAVHTEVEVVRDKLAAAEEREAERPEWAERETPSPEALEPQPAAIPADVSTWMSGIHDELGVVLNAIEALAERAAEPPPDTDARLAEELARLSAEFQLLRRRLPVRAKPITAAIEEAQVKWIADTVVRSILEAVQLVPEDDDDEWDIGEDDEPA